jgi:hypothetical protein
MYYEYDIKVSVFAFVTSIRGSDWPNLRLYQIKPSRTGFWNREEIPQVNNSLG